MSLNLSLHTRPKVPLEAECICPQRVQNLSQSGIEHLTVMHGNEAMKLADFFTVTGKGGLDIRVQGELNQVKYIGTQMSQGSITIEGNVGMHLGCAMTGGEIRVLGNAGDWVGPEMCGGRITITGNAGHMVGSMYRGQSVGIQGGEIIVHGDVKNETGSGMRRGLIAVGGHAGDFTAVNMLAGTIIVFGDLGIRSGAGMKRGTLVAFGSAALLPTFEYACTYHPVFLRFYLLHLRRLGLDVDDRYITGRYQRWSGDAIELNRGEILLYNR
jgi:formylmethanofuran dehydrogenase subunit C